MWKQVNIVTMLKKIEFERCFQHL